MEDGRIVNYGEKRKERREERKEESKSERSQQHVYVKSEYLLKKLDFFLLTDELSLTAISKVEF